MKQKIAEGKTYLGIELGSTRIKACLIDDSYMPIASGGYEWENKFVNGYWTYPLEKIHEGIKACYASLKKDVYEKYGVKLSKFASIGISGMMHGYLAFDKDANLLAPFRTWRSTCTGAAAEKLTELFNFNIPQRWSISHLYQVILDGEKHVRDIAHITTLSGYIHYLLTGRWELGINDASGMFPILGKTYNPDMLEKFDSLVSQYGFPWKIDAILPEVKVAGDEGTYLSAEGAKFLDAEGDLVCGIPLCPPEGDMGTGMVATNSVKQKTGNVSAGTSINSLLVLEKNLVGMYPEIDIVTTPDGSPVAMAHSNNGCSELDQWVGLFGEFAKMAGADIDKSELYSMLYENTLQGDTDCGEVVSYNFLASEPAAGIKNGKPTCYRTQNSNMTLANFFRSQLYAVVAALKFGMNILFEKENVKAESFTAHGGLFKVKGVAQRYLAAALNTPVSVSETAGEGGAWGMALLAAYMIDKNGLSLGDWLDSRAFGGMEKETVYPDKDDVKGFNSYFELYKASLPGVDRL